MTNENLIVKLPLIILKTIVSLNVKKNDYTGYVVDNTLSFSPLVVRCAHKSFGGTLCVPLLEEGPYNIGNLLVIKEFPNTVTG